MDEYYPNGQDKRQTLDKLTKSLERLSIFNARGKDTAFKLPPQIDIDRVLGDLDLDSIETFMFPNKPPSEGRGTGRYRGRRPGLG